MAEDSGGLENGEEGREEEGTEENKPELFNLYRLVYSQPDVILSLILQILDVLEEKGVLTEEEINNVFREGIERWKERR